MLPILWCFLHCCQYLPVCCTVPINSDHHPHSHFNRMRCEHAAVHATCDQTSSDILPSHMTKSDSGPGLKGKVVLRQGLSLTAWKHGGKGGGGSLFEEWASHCTKGYPKGTTCVHKPHSRVHYYNSNEALCICVNKPYRRKYIIT